MQFNSPAFYSRFHLYSIDGLEIRSGIFTTATMVRSETEIWKSIAI